VSNESSLFWADRKFGSDAPALRRVVRKSLTAACTQSQNAQDSSRARKNHPFGSSLWTLQFQELADGIAQEFPDRHRLVELQNYSLAIVNNHVLYPVRSVNPRSAKAKEARVRKPVSPLRRQMFSVLGPEPIQTALWLEQTAQETARDVRTLMTRLGPSVHLVTISYVGGYKNGLVDIYMGDAELNARDGSLIYHDGEGVPVVPVVAKSARKAIRSVKSRAFDGGDPPEISLGVNVSHQPSASEAEPTKPSAVSDEEE
jgi:hypothetical protein